jgi:hypothetical protein
MKSGQMTFADLNMFTSEFVLILYPENKVMMASMRLESEDYFQGRCNVEVYIDEFKDLVNMLGYTDPITIILKFHWGLNTMIVIAGSRPLVNWTSTVWPMRCSIIPHSILQPL